MKLTHAERVTVTLPDELVKDIDRWEKNRSRFVAEAVRHELERRKRAELQKSLMEPHVDSTELAEQGYEDWFRGLPDEDTESLVETGLGTPVSWIPGEGWKELTIRGRSSKK
jgi:Arc/MetJ-type ribon-helix-helix transcriptional regulator